MKFSNKNQVVCVHTYFQVPNSGVRITATVLVLEYRSSRELAVLKYSVVNKKNIRVYGQFCKRMR